jgi:hypothetical protein
MFGKKNESKEKPSQNKGDVSTNPKARRRRKRRGKGGKTEEKKRIDLNSLVKTGSQFAPDGERVIDVSVTICPSSLATWPLAIVSRAYSMNTTNPITIWGMYNAMYYDFIALASNQVDVVSTRIAYVNALIQLVRAKTVRGQLLNVNYTFNNVSPGTAPVALIQVRNFNYYMYVNEGDDPGSSLNIQIPPPVVSLPQALEQYTNNLNFLQGQSIGSMLKTQNINEASQVFARDPSAYASNSLYFATGSCPSGGYASAENEVYGMSMPTTSVFTELGTNLERVARYFTLSAGDATSCFGLGFIPQFAMKNYSSRLPPIIKYINFDELWTIYANWFAQILVAASNVTGNVEFVNSYLANPVPLSYAIIAFRQALVKYLAASQAATQFQGYTPDGVVYWEAFRVSSNTVGKPMTPLLVPVLLQENVRGFEPKVYNYGKKTVTPERVSQTYLPCIGMFPTNDLVNPFIVDQEGNTNFVFGPIPSPEVGTSYIDGRSNVNVYDFNSSCINSAVVALNEIVAKLNLVAGGYGPFEGSSNCNLLAFTRYDQLGNSDFEVKMANTPLWAQNSAFKSKVADYNRKKAEFNERKKGVKRTLSQGPSEEKFRYLQTGITEYIPRYFSSAVPITNELKSVLTNMVIPSLLILENGQATRITQNMGQTAFSETFWFTVAQDIGNNGSNGSASIGEIMTILGIASAPGLAAKSNSEIARVLEGMQNLGKGGFLDALFKGVMEFINNV